MSADTPKGTSPAHAAWPTSATIAAAASAFLLILSMPWPATLDLALLRLDDCDRGPDITVAFSYHDKLRQL